MIRQCMHVHPNLPSYLFPSTFPHPTPETVNLFSKSVSTEHLFPCIICHCKEFCKIERTKTHTHIFSDEKI